MPSDLRSSSSKTGGGGQSQQPLLGGGDDGEASPKMYSPIRPTLSRKSTFRERDSAEAAVHATRKRWSYAAIFLALSLVSFCVQTETAVYIQKQLRWNKPYCMLYMTHGSWSLLWPFTLLIQRIQKHSTPWPTFWRRHYSLVRQTAQMVRYQALHLTPWQQETSPWVHMAKTTAFVTCALTVAGGSWYVAVNLTTASDLTAIYNCSAFFAYVFSVPLLKEKVQLSKVMSVGLAIAGVMIVAYGGESGSKHEGAPGEKPEGNYRFLGNVIIGVGSVLYGFYEVLYKKVACPPDDTSPGRGMVFAMAFGSMIGVFTLSILWIPLVILNWTGLEPFQLPRGEQAWMMLISVLSNAVFSGSFLVLISLTSPVLSSVAALLTIFLVDVISQYLPPPLYTPLTAASVVGGTLIMVAFGLLAWGTYREMNEEKKRRYSLGQVSESDVSDNEGRSGFA